MQSGVVHSLKVVIDGMDYADLGMAPATARPDREKALTDAFGFVYGPPWVAECAARVRTDCPTQPNDPTYFARTWVQHANSASDSADDTSGVVSSQYQGAGALLPIWTLSVPLDAGDPLRVANFKPVVSPH